MKLHEKIYTCRKKAGLSQEALAEKLSVSRQSVSKWETGESVPEINKIPILANIFNVTTDWLLNEEENIIYDTKENTSYPVKTENPSTISEKLLKFFAWIAGIYFLVSGIYKTAIACYSIFMIKSATAPFPVVTIIPLVTGIAMLAVGIVFIIILLSSKRKINIKRR